MRFGFTTYQWGKPWAIPEIIANCRKALAFGVEPRTSQDYAHGVELELTAAQRREVELQFVDSPVILVGMACGERFDSPDAAKLKASRGTSSGSSYTQATRSTPTTTPIRSSPANSRRICRLTRGGSAGASSKTPTRWRTQCRRWSPSGRRSSS